MVWSISGSYVGNEQPGAPFSCAISTSLLDPVEGLIGSMANYLCQTPVFGIHEVSWHCGGEFYISLLQSLDIGRAEWELLVLIDTLPWPLACELHI